MQLRTFDQQPENISIEGDFIFNSNKIEILFSTIDVNLEIENSPRDQTWIFNKETANANRTHELWKTTCFEAFWAEPKQKSYWEFNVAANGKWNLYFFKDYRNPQPPMENSDFDLNEITTTKNTLKCILIPKIKIESLEVALTSVIKTKNNNIYYFATAHTGEKPDFHRRDSFKILKT